MKSFIAGATLTLCTLTASVALAQPGKTYPKVHTNTGSLYGPTQAHYQYERRYGHSWNGGQRASRGHGRHFRGGHRHHHHGHHLQSYGGYGYYPSSGYWSGGYPSSGYYYGYAPLAPIIIQPHPLFVGPDPFDNPVLWKDQPIEDLEKLKKLLPFPDKKQPPLVVKKSNATARQRSLHFQGQGDLSFRERRFTKAYSQYRQASRAARDLTAPYFRMGLALAAAGHYGSAVREIKHGLQLDPDWPLTGESLGERFGDENVLAKNNTLHRVAQWVREDIRDPERLFLMGVLLHFNRDPDRAIKFFETADLLAGSPRHIQLFLRAEKGDADKDAGIKKPPQAPPQNGAALPQPIPQKQIKPAQPPLPPVPEPEKEKAAEASR